MPVANSFFVGVSALPAKPVTRHAKTLKRSISADWIRLLMSVMAVQRRSIFVPLPISIVTMRGSQTENTGRSFGIPEPGST